MFVTGLQWFFLGLCCVASCSLSLALVLNHARSWSQPLIQRKIVSILWMVPIYGFEAWLSLRFPDRAPLLDMLRDCYEAYVVYVFFSLCVAYLGAGGADQASVDMNKVHLALQLQGSVRHPKPFDRCLPPVNLQTGTEHFLLRCKVYVLQFVLIKPVCTGVAFLLWMAGFYREGEIDFAQGYVYIAFVDNVSVSLSLYYLVLFYRSTRTALASHKPLAKFMCIKCVVFFTWWQGFALSILCWLGVLQGSSAQDDAYSCSELSTSIQDVLIQFEVLALAIVHMRVFSSAPFRFGPHQPSVQGHRLASLLPIDGQALSADLQDVSPGSLPHALSASRPQVAEQRAYMPPATDISPVVPTSDAGARGTVSQVELSRGGDEVCVEKAPPAQGDAEFPRCGAGAASDSAAGDPAGAVQPFDG